MGRKAHHGLAMTPLTHHTNWPLVAFWTLLALTGLPAFVGAGYALLLALEALFT